MKNVNTINFLLFVSAINLTLMIPGGFIESRDFSHINPMILGGFNVFLTTLGMVSLFLIYFNRRNHTWARRISLLCGLSYLFVYVIDVLKIFPQSPTPMPLSLLILEILGIALAIPLAYFSYVESNTKENMQSHAHQRNITWLLVLAIIISIVIIIFATKSAMTAQ